MSSTQAHKPRAKNFGALLNASSELERLRQENELLKIQIEQLRRWWRTTIANNDPSIVGPPVPFQYFLRSAEKVLLDTFINKN
jgi:hypothetical protein